MKITFEISRGKNKPIDTQLLDLLLDKQCLGKKLTKNELALLTELAEKEAK